MKVKKGIFLEICLFFFFQIIFLSNVCEAKKIVINKGDQTLQTAARVSLPTQYFNAGSAAFASGNYEKAIEYIRQLLDINLTTLRLTIGEVELILI